MPLYIHFIPNDTLLKQNIVIIESYYMRNGINEKSGVRVVVEHSTKNPTMSKGIDAMPGTETNIGVKKHVVERLKKPYKSNCTNEYLDPDIKKHADRGFDYSAKICKGLCFARESNQGCGCFHPSLLEGFSIEDWYGTVLQMHPCNISSGSEDAQCLIGLHVIDTGDPGTNWDQPCGCNPECTEISYEVISQIQF